MKQSRDVYLKPTADLRTRLGIDKDFILKLTGSVYGLRNAPRAWYRRVRTDLEALGWSVRQLDQCVFRNYDGDALAGVCDVYVDDLILAGKVKDPDGKRPKENSWDFTNGESGIQMRSHYVESAISRRTTTPS